jgi:hypothetical protein
MAILTIGLGILIVFLVMSGRWNRFWGAIVNPVFSSPQDEGRGAEILRKPTRGLLLCGAIAGPAFVLVVLLQDYTLSGVDPRTQPLSLLALGDWGWIQTSNFIGAGVLNLLYAVGLRRRLHGGRSGMAAPVLVALYGLGLVSSGLFQTDPANGFPPGAIAPSELSWHGALHDVAGTVVFFALALALLAFRRAFLERNERSWALYATASAAALLVLFLTAGTVGEARGLRLAVLIGWMAASLIALRLSVPDRSTDAMGEPRT